MTTVTRHTEYRASSHRTTSYHIPEDQVHWKGRKPDTPIPKSGRMNESDIPGVPQMKPTRVFFPDESSDEIRRYFKTRPSPEEEHDRQQAEFYATISASFKAKVVMRVEENVELPRPQTSYAVRRPSIGSESERRESLAEIKRLFEEAQQQHDIEKERQRLAQAQQRLEEPTACPCVIL